MCSFRLNFSLLCQLCRDNEPRSTKVKKNKKSSKALQSGHCIFFSHQPQNQGPSDGKTDLMTAHGTI
jgi:hypothetical protein